MRRRGSNSLEFALILPIMVMTAFGVSEYGYVISVERDLMSSVREGTRAGAATMINDDREATATAVAQATYASLGHDAEVVWTVELIGTNPDQLLRVRADVPHAGLTGLSVPLPTTVSAELTMRVEDQDAA